MEKEPGWEREFYNSYGNYTGYRFKDFKAGCKFHNRDNEDGSYVMCKNPSHEWAGETTFEDRPCECRMCPCVEEDIDDDDDIDYSEGDQPVIVMEAHNVQIEGQAASGLSRSNDGLCVNTKE